MPIEQAAIAAVRAGMHLLEVCKHPELILRCYEALLTEAERSAAFRKLLLSRARTGLRLRRLNFSHPTSKVLSPRRFSALADEVRQFANIVEEARLA